MDDHLDNTDGATISSHGAGLLSRQPEIREFAGLSTIDEAFP
jgi:hypothetical protein